MRNLTHSAWKTEGRGEGLAALDIVRRVGTAKRSTFRVLVSAGTMGGPGGAQRALGSILRALAEDDVDVVARKVVELPPVTDTAPRKVWNARHWRWLGAKSSTGLNGTVARVLNPVRTRVFPRYDLYLRLYQGVDVNRAAHAQVRLLVPSGNRVTLAEARGHDYVAMQAPDNAALVEDGAPLTLLSPPLYPLTDHADEPRGSLPDDFYLTVFNPYGPIKGADDLERAADRAPLPIVWCHSDRGITTDVPVALQNHPRVVHVLDPSPSELRWLYERCAAYLCFSKTEGFGWSIADGLRHAPVVVSRDIGILTHPAARSLSGVIRTGETWDVDWSTMPVTRGDLPDRDLTFQAPETFRRALVTLVERAR